jgi:hypothetical protein
MSRRDGGRLRERASPPGEPPAAFDRPGAGARLVERACAMKVAQEQAEGPAVDRLVPTVPVR